MKILTGLVCLGIVCLPARGSELVVSKAGTQYEENFNGFRGTYETLPAGCYVSLNSSNVLVSTNTDFHGVHTGGVTAGGCYAWSLGNEDYALGYQPTDAEFTPGFFLVVISNAMKSAVQEMDISYEIVCLNNADRSSSLNFEISFDGKFYGRLAGLVFVSEQARGDSGTWVRTSRSARIEFPRPITAGKCIWVRWYGDDAGGASTRDEYGIDNIKVTLHCKEGMVIAIR